MIQVFFGENSFEIERAVRAAIAAFAGDVEKRDGEGLNTGEFSDLVSAQTLFVEKRLVLIKRLSENKTVWAELPALLERQNDIDLVLLEAKLDKRTATYKWLQKHASITECTPWTYRDQKDAEEWLRARAREMKFTLTHAQAKKLLERAGFEQWRLYHALEKLALAEIIDEQTIEQVIELHPEENVFSLLETALGGDVKRLQQKIDGLKQTEDAYKVTGLLASQLLSLAALVFGSKSPAETAKDLGAAPFVLSKLATPARRISEQSMRQMIQDAAEADRLMKTISVDPWTIVEQLLQKIARIAAG